MKLNQKKANKIMGLFAMLNKIEEDGAIERYNSKGRAYQEPFVFFDCSIKYSEIWGEFTCELVSVEMVCSFDYWKDCVTSKQAFGYDQPIAQFIMQSDPCSYQIFDDAVRFVRAALKAGGTVNMNRKSHKVVCVMPDYLSFEPRS